MVKKTQFTISVIIPVYNAGKFVKNSVESALNQRDVGEIILVEDGSTDNSLLVCQKLAKKFKKIKLYRHTDKKNHGAGESRNLGIKNVSFNYIAFLDADDYYLPNRFDKDKKLLMNDKSIEGVYNALGVKIYENDAKKRTVEKPIGMTTLTERISPENLFENMSPIGKKGHFSIDTLTVRKDVFKKIGYFNNFEIGEDTHLFVRMAAKCRLVGGRIDEPVAIRGLHKLNRIKDTNKMFELRPILYKSLFEWGLQNDLSPSRSETLWIKYFRTILNLKNQNNNLVKKMKIINILIEHIVIYPDILKFKSLYNNIPFWGRFL